MVLSNFNIHKCKKYEKLVNIENLTIVVIVHWKSCNFTHKKIYSRAFDYAGGK